MIDWAAFGIVALAALVSASVLVSLFAFGLRLLNVGLGVDAEETGTEVHTTPTGSVTVVAAQPAGRPADRRELRPDPGLVQDPEHLVVDVHGAGQGIDLRVPFDHGDPQPAPAEQHRQAEPGRAATDHDDVVPPGICHPRRMHSAADRPPPALPAR